MARRYMYNLSHQVATETRFGRLCPTCVLEVAPGDTFSGKVGVLIRLSPLKRALLTDIRVDQFFVYVPHRLVFSDWERFITDGPMDTPNVTIPAKTINDQSTDCPKFLFIRRPASGEGSITVSNLRLRGYNLSWNELFRDEYENPVGSDSVSNARWGQTVSAKKDYWSLIQRDFGRAQEFHNAQVQLPTTANAYVRAHDIIAAIQRQKISSRRATYGTRYIDALRYMGVSVNYQMLQRPEVVATARGNINVTDVVNTSDTGLGSMAGHGISGSRLRIRRKQFPEHGTLLGFAVIRPIQADATWVDYFDTPRDYTAFYDPLTATLPPVEIRSKDVQPVATNDTGIGFLPWGHWYRNALSRIHSDLGTEWVGNFQDGKPVSVTDQIMKKYVDTVYDNMFSDTSNGHAQISVVNSLRAVRMIPPVNRSAAIG